MALKATPSKNTIDGPIVFENIGYLLNGTEQDDMLTGSSGNDFIYGNGGNDRLSGGAGNDLIDGGFGHDYLIGGAGADTFIGGQGFDTVSYTYSALGITVDFSRGEGFSNDAKGDTFSGIERVIGSNQADVIIGSDTTIPAGFRNAAFGMQLEGGGGADFLTGGRGNDVLVGGTGDDTLRGDMNPVPPLHHDPRAADVAHDTFVIGFDTGTDLIVDFEQGRDLIAFDKPDFEGRWPAIEMFGNDRELATSIFTIDPGDKLWFDDANNVLYEIHPTFAFGGLTALNAEAIAYFGTDVSLRASDFILI